MIIRRAGLDDLDAVSALFDAYRQFYGLPSDIACAREFLRARIDAGESVIFLAEREQRVVGFVQLYRLFSSTAARPGLLWLLNDLYVRSGARGCGLGRLLMERARQHALETGAVRIELATARDNRVAQALYESLGYRRDEAYYSYALALDQTQAGSGS